MNKENRWAFSIANVFGVTSPNNKSRKVITPIAIPIPFSPHISMDTDATKVDAAIFTNILPIRTAESNRTGFCNKDLIALVLLPLSSIFRRVKEFREKRAVSEPEKKAESMSRINTKKILYIMYDKNYLNFSFNSHMVALTTSEARSIVNFFSVFLLPLMAHTISPVSTETRRAEKDT